MYSRRCAYCQTLQQVDAQAQKCSYCGRDFSSQGSNTSRQKSLPPAASHRAGHTFGLHPEDQPYQSSMMIAQHSPSEEPALPRRIHRDPEYIVFPATSEAPALKAQRAALVRSRRSVRRPAKKVEQAKARRLAFFRPKVWSSRRMISSLLTLSCVIFLLASSIIAFVLIGKRTTVATAVVQISPDALRVNDIFTLSGRGFVLHDRMSFYYDNHQVLIDEQGKPLRVSTDANGHFSLQVRVPGSWSVGNHVIDTVDSAQNSSILAHITVLPLSVQPPVLQISPLSSRFSGAVAGIVSSQSLTLTNTGGGQVSWVVTSDQSWLSTVPASGSFSGSQNVQVTVNRGNLAPQAYVGHLVFTQKGTNGSVLTIPVYIDVTPTPAALAISTTALTYAASTSQDPENQFITLHNSGQQDGNWSSTLTGGSSTSWLALTPDHGTIAPGEDEAIMVSAHSADLPVGTYQGVINFAGDISAQVNVSMSVAAAGNLVTSPLTLDFTALVGQVPAEKQVTLQNSGGTSLTWQSTVITVDQGNWLQMTPAQGSLDAGKQAIAEVSIASQKMSAGSYQGKITFTSSSGINQQIAVSLIVSAPVISVQPATLTFVTAIGSDPPVQTITITNAGNTTLQWTATAEGTGSSALTITPKAGTLALHQSVILTVALHMPQSSSAPLSPTILLKGGSGGSMSLSQSVPVNITANSEVPSATLPAQPDEAQ